MSVQVPVRRDGFIYIPPALRERAGIKDAVQVIESEQGLLLKPAKEREALSWAEFFAQGLRMQRPALLDLSETRFDDLWL